MRPMQAPSGQLVHHLQRGTDAWWERQALWGPQGPQHTSWPSSSHPVTAEERSGSRAPPHTTHLSISRLQGPGMAGQALTAGPETSTFLRGARHWGAGGDPTAQPAEARGLGHHTQPGPILPPPAFASSWCLLDTFLQTPMCVPNWTQHRIHEPAPPPSHLVMVPYPQGRDTGQYAISPTPPATEAFSLPNFSLTVPPLHLCSPLPNSGLFLSPWLPLWSLPIASPCHSSLTTALGPSAQACPCPLLRKPLWLPVTHSREPQSLIPNP